MELKVHQFDPLFSTDELYQIGEKYIRRVFLKKQNGKKTNFCSTVDGRPVYYSSANNYHFLDKENGGKPLLMRMQRIHWIIPILQETATETIFKKDTFGDKILYYLPQLRYLIIVSYEADYSLWLNTAYRITNKNIRLKLNKLFSI